MINEWQIGEFEPRRNVRSSLTHGNLSPSNNLPRNCHLAFAAPPVPARPPHARIAAWITSRDIIMNSRPIDRASDRIWDLKMSIIMAPRRHTTRVEPRYLCCIQNAKVAHLVEDKLLRFSRKCMMFGVNNPSPATRWSPRIMHMILIRVFCSSCLPTPSNLWSESKRKIVSRRLHIV